ncbi:hypothetical protein F5Y15DRAFT_412357 [Xylariaceae sp. FL0016]|nr:hypothetical protein F5Y15DRAFT_412357 [Xylariaceae sp. FL0016]
MATQTIASKKRQAPDGDGAASDFTVKFARGKKDIYITRRMTRSLTSALSDSEANPEQRPGSIEPSHVLSPVQPDYLAPALVQAPTSGDDQGQIPEAIHLPRVPSPMQEDNPGQELEQVPGPAPVTKGKNKKPTTDIHEGKPEPHGETPVWSDTRSALCDALEYFKAHQGAVYSKDKVAAGFLIDKEVGDRDQFQNQIVISSCGGGRVYDPNTGSMVRNATQGKNSQGRVSLLGAMEVKKPVVIIAGQGNKLWPVKPKHYYNVLGKFFVTNVWTEVSFNGTDFVEYHMARFEKADLHIRSWWSPEGDVEQDRYKKGEYVCESETCTVCNTESPKIFTQGWVCLTTGCQAHFKVNGQYPQDPNSWTYNDNFLRKREESLSWSLDKELSLPILQKETDANGEHTFGTEKVFKNGIVCPKCRGCSRRVDWRFWLCENPKCKGYTYELTMHRMPHDRIAHEERELANSRSSQPYVDGSILRFTQNMPGFDVETMCLPAARGSEYKFAGSITIFRPSAAARERPGGSNDLFMAMQDATMNGSLELKRKTARSKGVYEELTSHFVNNIGADYKYGVVVDTSSGFAEAPEAILEALSRLTWAGRTAIDIGTKQFQEQDVSIDKVSAPNEFKEFNEQLVLGYFEGSHISYHDDGEKELGPTVATLSLGSPSTMYFRPKLKADIPEIHCPPNVKRKNGRHHVVKFSLNSGDMVIMHGTKIHQLYEHKVDAEGARRFAMTCRYVRPEMISDDERRAESLKKGAVPEEWQNRYHGEH